jgi:hypothetical protein
VRGSELGEVEGGGGELWCSSVASDARKIRSVHITIKRSSLGNTAADANGAARGES